MCIFLIIDFYTVSNRYGKLMQFHNDNKEPHFKTQVQEKRKDALLLEINYVKLRHTLKPF